VKSMIITNTPIVMPAMAPPDSPLPGALGRLELELPTLVVLLSVLVVLLSVLVVLLSVLVVVPAALGTDPNGSLVASGAPGENKRKSSAFPISLDGKQSGYASQGAPVVTWRNNVAQSQLDELYCFVNLTLHILEIVETGAGPKSILFEA
jgi:hypothetical protein